MKPSPTGVQQVLEQEHHELEIDGVRTLLEVHPHELSGGFSPIDTASHQESSYQVKVHDSEDDSSDSECEDDEPVVEVTDFKPSTSDEMLRLYFETPRKSGGGDLKTFEYNPKTEAIILTFENPSVAHSVVARSHRVDGASLSVRQIVRKKPRPRPVKKRCLFLSGIPDGCDSELVTMFFENRSGTDEFKIQYGEMPGTAICTFAEDIPDMEGVIKSICTKTLKGSFVTAEKVHESDSILVQGVSPKTSLEMIELYFDNKKKSGGTGVREVQQGPTDSQAIVYFEDWKVVDDVIAKRGPHKVGNVEIFVEEYHECLGRLSTLDVPTPHVPKPVTVQVQEPIMEFIFGKGQHTKKTLTQKLRDAKAILKWPDGDDKTTARLEPLLEDGQRQSSWLKWSETATQVLTDSLNRCKSSRIAVPSSFWKDTVDKINQLGTKSLFIQLDAYTHQVSLVGEQQDVDEGYTDIDRIIKEFRTKAEYEAQQTNVDITLTEEKSQHFIICGIQDKIEKDFPNLKIVVISLQDKIRLVLEGSRKIVQEAELSMRRQMDSLEKVEIKMGRNKVKFVQNHIDKIQEILRSQGIRAACNGSDDGKIIILGATKKDTVQAKAYINQEIEEDVIPIKDQTVLSVIKSQAGSDLLDETSKQKSTVVNINTTEDVVQLAGFRTSLEEVKQSILEFLTANVINKEFINMNKSKMDVLLKRHGKSLDSLAEQHKHNHMKIAPESGSRTGVFIQGNEEGLMIARRFVNSLAEGIEDASFPSNSESDEQELLRQDVEMKEMAKDQREEGDDEDRFVEVTGFNRSSEKVLKMHFENPIRSGGGDIKAWEHDKKTGAIRMTFENTSIASKVIARQHKVGGDNLMVRLIVKKKPHPRPVKKRCLFLSGIPDWCNPELVTMFVENRSGTDEFKIQYGEMPGTALCTFTEDIQDFEKVIKRISSKLLSGAYLTAEKMKESDCILVEGVSPKASLEMIELYFDNKRKSGGTGVRDVQQGPTDTQAIVYYEDWKVVGDVLSKGGPYKVGGTELFVEEYHECLGRLSPLDVPYTPYVPKPVTVQVQEPIMEFIFGKGQHTKKTLIQKLRDAKAILKWPDGDDKTTARLEPLLEDGQRQPSWLKWSETATQVLTEFLNRCKSSRIVVPPPFWKDVIDKINQLNTQSFSIQLIASNHSLTLVGEQQFVDKGCTDINRIIKELKAKAEYEAEETKEDILLTEEKSQPFIIFGIKNVIENDFPNLKITVMSLQDKIKLTFEGSRKIVWDAELSMRRKMDNLEKVELKTGCNKVKFVRNVIDKIHEILWSQGIRAACKGSDDGKIIISGATKKDTTEAKAYFSREIEEDVIPIRGQAAMDVLQNQTGRRLLDAINKQKFVMAAISNKGGNIVELAGFKTNLGETKHKIIDFLKDNVILKKIVPANKNKICLIDKFHGADLVNVAMQNAKHHVKIQPQKSGRHKGFVIQGNEEGLEAARQVIVSLIDRIKEQPYPVSRTGMAQLFQESKGKKFLESLEDECQCVIRENVQEDSDDEAEVGGGAAVRPMVSTRVLCRIALPNGFTLKVCRGDLTRQQVDCIVNATNTELKHVGGLAAAVVEAGGRVIQTECEQILRFKRRQLYVGEPVHTTNGKLPCKRVFHVAGPKWPHHGGATSIPDDDKSSLEEHLLYDGVIACLKLANKLNMQSIAIPAISTGVYGFPVDLAAKQILNAVAEFCQNMPIPTLTEIHFTNNDQPTCDVFKRAVMDRFSQFQEDEDGTDIGRAPTDRQAYSPIQRDDTGMLQTKIGSVCLQVGRGDLVKEATDVIVNSVGLRLALQGPVSKAILTNGGKSIAKECDTLRKKDPKKLIYWTGGGSLQCSFICHVVTPRTPEDIKTIVFKTLQQAEDKKVKSVSFPALGTGQAGQSVADCASTMLTAVGEFAVRKKPQYLRLIRLVIFQRDMVSGFQDALKSGVGTSYREQKVLLSKGLGLMKSAWSVVSGGAAPNDASTDDESLEETIILNIYAMDMSSVKRASGKIDQFQDEEYTSEYLSDEHGMIDKMTDEHRAELRAIGKKYNVTINCHNKGHAKFVKVEGCNIKVKDACIKIQELFTRMQIEELKMQRSVHLFKEVQWKYGTPRGLEAYDPEVNVIIEDAYNKKRPSVSLNLEDGQVTINFQTMQETSLAGNMYVHRVDLKKAASFELPPNWIPMDKKEHFKMAQLTAGSADYIEVETQLQKSMGGHQIQEIHRIQNRDLLVQYQSRKEAMEARLGRTNIEETLFHGTDEQTCDKINKFGFNRSFCGKNATAYGNGTYFAVNANYSARPQYAKPNANGVQHMYLTKVLVGDYIRGNHGMITPPNKPSHPDQQYDCAVDNVNQPGIYVIFHDAQAYPEYLIKFQ
ncbi:protein mono-ADP-ribosyltransferase PARP14-like [Patiria miniata]|uniref:Poly [ADP-ribose] polymerase n=1 Tax=Patiria miniata TaxID=46514 RepID=A0A914B5Z8_PATMI|nr:protein mono-ADP-ribosyltransferase PARP14-like [Patiria miniata]